MTMIVKGIECAMAKVKKKLSRCMPWRLMGGEEV
jgi:hypothetical protein